MYLYKIHTTTDLGITGLKGITEVKQSLLIVPEEDVLLIRVTSPRLFKGRDKGKDERRQRWEVANIIIKL